MKKTLSIVTLILLQINILCQDADILSSKIILEQQSFTVEVLLGKFENEHNIAFSFNSLEVPTKSTISILKREITLEDILNSICTRFELKYDIQSNIVILKKAGKFTISGYVEDSGTGEKLIGASVYIRNSYKGTISNNYGFFSLTVPEGKIELEVSYVGYSKSNISLDLDSDTSLLIKLEPGIKLDDVNVYYHDDFKLKTSGISIEKLSVNTLTKLPGLGGETDLLNFIEYLPGVQRGSDASSGLNIRGGSPEQNLLLLDGIPIYNSNHAFGLFSVFNSDAIKNITLIKGGFPARYGGRLSSVIDIRMKEGNMKEIQGNAQIGLISSKASLEGPIIKDRASFILSARRSYIDLFLPKKPKKNGDYPSFFFNDMNLKINSIITDKDKFYLSLFTGKDRFTLKDIYRDEDGIEYDIENIEAIWGNTTVLFRWNHLFNNKLFSNLSLLSSKYDLTIDVSEDELFNDIYENESNKYNSGINDISMKLDFDYYQSVNHSMKFGLEYTRHKFNPGTLQYLYKRYWFEGGRKVYSSNGNVDYLTSNDPIKADEFSVFMEDDIKIGERHKANIGLRYAGFAVDSSYYSSIEPRISYSYLINPRIALKAAYSSMNQYIHLLTQSSMGLPTDLWLPVTSKIKPQNSRQVVIGLIYDINYQYELSVESYYKDMDQLYAYVDGADYLSSNNTWQENIEMGTGSSYGLELMLKKKVGNIKGWISYTYSKTQRQFENINGGLPYPYKYDRTHQATIILNYTINDKSSVNAVWTYATGMAYTLPTEKYNSFFNIYGWNSSNNDQKFIDHIPGRNLKRMPDYHRLDVSYVNKRERKSTVRTWNLGVYNLYGRFNPYLIYWDTDYEGTPEGSQARRKIKHIALYTIMPAVSYRIDF